MAQQGRRTGPPDWILRWAASRARGLAREMTRQAVMANAPALREDYPYIVAYCAYMGSAGYYVAEELCRARCDAAPHDAVSSTTVYQGEGKHREWLTVAQLGSSDLRDWLDSWVAARYPNSPYQGLGRLSTGNGNARKA